MTSRESKPKSKFMSMLILRDVIESCLRPETKFNKLFTLFLTHSLLKSIDSFCDDIDPAKSVEDKGKKYFPGEAEVGNSFIRCNLEIIKALAIRFPKGKNEDATAFKKTYNKLLQKKVNFPNDYRFLILQPVSKVKGDEAMA